MSEREKPNETPEVIGCVPSLLWLVAIKFIGIILMKSSFVLALVVLVGGSLLIGIEPDDRMACLVAPLAIVIFFALLFGVVKIKNRFCPPAKKE